jgi:hypothetical protein
MKYAYRMDWADGSTWIVPIKPDGRYGRPIDPSDWSATDGDKGRSDEPGHEPETLGMSKPSSGSKANRSSGGGKRGMC